VRRHRLEIEDTLPHQAGHVACVAMEHFLADGVRAKLLQCVGARDLEQAVAGRRARQFHPDQRFADQVQQAVAHHGGGQTLVGEHRVGGLQREAGLEHPAAAQDFLLRRGQQVIAPVQQGA
jgi:hypothetical protein